MSRKKYTALVLEQDTTRRTRLKTATAATNAFERVDICSTEEEALKRLNLQHGETDVIFISGQILPEQQDLFIKAARKTKLGKVAAYISVQKRTDRDDAVSATSLIRGLDGVLWEPYSVSSVLETTTVADRIKAADILEKKRAATALLVDEALGEIDEIGRSTLNGDEDRSRLGMQKLRKVGGDLRSLISESGPLVIEVFRVKFSIARAQTMQIVRQPYGGVSVRVQRVLDKRAEKQTLSNQ